MPGSIDAYAGVFDVRSHERSLEVDINAMACRLAASDAVMSSCGTLERLGSGLAECTVRTQDVSIFGVAPFRVLGGRSTSSTQRFVLQTGPLRIGATQYSVSAQSTSQTATPTRLLKVSSGWLESGLIPVELSASQHIEILGESQLRPYGSGFFTLSFDGDTTAELSIGADVS